MVQDIQFCSLACAAARLDYLIYYKLDVFNHKSNPLINHLKLITNHRKRGLHYFRGLKSIYRRMYRKEILWEVMIQCLYWIICNNYFNKIIINVLYHITAFISFFPQHAIFRFIFFKILQVYPWLAVHAPGFSIFLIHQLSDSLMFNLYSLNVWFHFPSVFF